MIAGMVGDAVGGLAGHEQVDGDRRGIGAVELAQLGHQPLVERVEAGAGVDQLGGQGEVLGRPGPQRGAVLLDADVDQRPDDVPRRPALGQLGHVGAQLDDPQREVADPLEAPTGSAPPRR